MQEDHDAGEFHNVESAWFGGNAAERTKIFLLASTSRELRCQCPIVTPASFGGAACAKADPAASCDASHSVAIKVFIGPPPVERMLACYPAMTLEG
jgi:hypothetical protein